VRLREGDRVHELLVHETSDGTDVVVDGQRLRLRVEEVGRGRFLVTQGLRRDVIHCVRDGGLVHLFWRGAVYRLAEEREGAWGPKRGAGGGLEAPMPGKVIAVRVALGQEVAKGQELLVIEAMKMENALRAPRAGRVKAILAEVGEMVSPGAVLVDLE
jgi:3-methylcrotonyl-CoA carboxylase alpha subunit